MSDIGASFESYLERDKKTPKNKMRIVRMVKSKEPAAMNALRTEVSNRSVRRWKMGVSESVHGNLLHPPYQPDCIAGSRTSETISGLATRRNSAVRMWITSRCVPALKAISGSATRLLSRYTLSP